MRVIVCVRVSVRVSERVWVLSEWESVSAGHLISILSEMTGRGSVNMYTCGFIYILWLCMHVYTSLVHRSCVGGLNYVSECLFTLPFVHASSVGHVSQGTPSSYVFENESCVSAKEPKVSTKEPCVSTKTCKWVCLCVKERCVQKREKVSASLYEDAKYRYMYRCVIYHSQAIFISLYSVRLRTKPVYTCTAVLTHAHLYACMHSVVDACWWMCVSMSVCAGNDSQVSNIARSFWNKTPVFVGLFCKSDLAKKNWRVRVSFAKETL